MSNLRRCFENYSSDLEKRKHDLASRQRDLDADKEEVKRNLEENGQDLRELERLEKWKLINLENEENRYEEVKRSVRAKESELERVQASLSEALMKLDSLEKSVVERSREAESKAKEHDSIERELREFEGVIEMNEKRVREVKKETEMKSCELNRIEISIDECDRTMKSKEKSLGMVQRNIEQSSRELEIQTKKLVLVRESGATMTRSIDQYFFDLEFKMRRVEKLLEQIEEAELKLDNMCLVREKVVKKLAEIEQKEKSFSSRESPVKELFKEFESRKNELERKARLDGKFVSSTMIKVEPSEPDQTPFKTRACREICSDDKACPEHIQKLIERGEIIHAVGHILELKLTDKFSPVSLLTEYFHDTANIMKLVCDGEDQDEKIKAMNKGLAIFKATIDCVIENNLPISIEKLMKLVRILEERLALPIATKASPLKNTNKCS